MERRILYHCCGEVTIPAADNQPTPLELDFRGPNPPTEEKIKEEIYPNVSTDSDLYRTDGLIVQIMKAHYGKKEQNPVDMVCDARIGANSIGLDQN